MEEIETEDEESEDLASVKAAIEEQVRVMQEWAVEKASFVGIKQFEEEVVERLNAITRKHGVHYLMYQNFSRDSPKYLSLICRGCKHKCLLWFTKDSNDKFTYSRPPYGLLMHHNLNSHV